MTLQERLEALAAAIRNKINAMMPRLMPLGGANGQVLAKTSATDFEVGWASVVPAARTVSSGTGLAGGGDLSANRTLSLDPATTAEVRASNGNRAITSTKLAEAAAIVGLADAASVAVDWAAGVNFDVTLTANRALANPTNVTPGTVRTIMVKASTGTARTLTFGTNYKGDLPTLNDITNAKYYLLTLYAYTATHIVISSVRGL